ncbi:MAG: family 43 glycosylhydrolase [Eubacteriales bacterium]
MEEKIKDAMMSKLDSEKISAATMRKLKEPELSDDTTNDFFTNFKYSKITGIGKEEGVSRRDPSKIIQVDGIYYVYYTCRKTAHKPVGIFVENTSDEIPTFDWDLCDIYYATSKDGFHWEEQGIAIARSPKGEYGDRSLSTPDILIWKGKYYLYYQSFTGYFKTETQDYCGVSLAVADSPRGPWIKKNEPIVAQGELEDWDSMAIHDPYPLVYKGKIWMFYKGQNLRIGGLEKNLVRAQGVAIADNPEGPYMKHPLNPLLNSGHETFLYPYKEGIAAVLTFDGPEKNTVQYAEDGIDFQIKSHLHVPPIAAGVYSSDAYTDSGNANGVSWGLCHMECGTVDEDVKTYIARFDCDLDRSIKREKFRNQKECIGRFGEETYFRKNMELSGKYKC